MAAIGSRTWAARTHGALTPGPQLLFAAQAITRELKTNHRQITTAARAAARANATHASATPDPASAASLDTAAGASTGHGRGAGPGINASPGRDAGSERAAGPSAGADVLLAGRLVPATAVARHVTDFVRTVLPDPLLQHSIRSWLWGSMLAELDQIEYDDERLYVAALLHDVGLIDDPGTDAACFAVHGSNIARRAVIEAGATNAFANDVADAIAAHFNVNVPLSWGAEPHLLHAGTHLDVIGLRLPELAPDTIAQVHTRAPRTGFADHFLDAMRKEARLRRTSRAAVLWRLGMKRSIHRFQDHLG